ncbi:MAG: [Thermoguttaceae bacterium]|nr:[FeFe] hydrogenase, group A [Thermoguttaceae bacterium]
MRNKSEQKDREQKIQDRRHLLKIGLAAGTSALFTPVTLLAQGRHGNGPRGGPGHVTGTPAPVGEDNPAILWKIEECEKCDHCEKSCGAMMSVLDHYDFMKTGKAICIHCGQCINLCKSGAKSERFHYPRARRIIADPKRVTAMITAPSVRVSLGELFDLPAGENVEGKMVAALKKLGFDYVFDGTFGADVTVVEESREFVERFKAGQVPMFTSCCPSWIKFAEYWYPEFLPNISSVKSPLLIQGTLVKTFFAKEAGIDPEALSVMSVAPCTAKKFEIVRPEMNASGQYLDNPDIRDMDLEITCRELGSWIKLAGIDFAGLEPEPFDKLMGRGSEAGVMFGNTGGVMEAVLRTAYFEMIGRNPPEELLKFEPIRGLNAVREATVDFDGTPVRVAAVHGGANIRALLDRIKAGDVQYDMVEVMACPGGCIGGGGQPIVKGREAFNKVRVDRNAGLYRAAGGNGTTIRLSHENKELLFAYEQFLNTDNKGETLAHQLLHTTYQSRAADLG